MGVQVGRIEKDFVLKSLMDEGAITDVHGNKREMRCKFNLVGEEKLELTPTEGGLEGFQIGEEVRIFFYLKNNYHTFTSTILALEGSHMTVSHPEGVYKNLQRKYERVKATEALEVSFILKGKKVELNFPRSERIGTVEAPGISEDFDSTKINMLIRDFRKKLEDRVTGNKITMLRDRIAKNYEERVIIKTGKVFWIPTTEEDFPIKDPFPDERIITKKDLIKFEETSGTQPYLITSKLGNLLYEKSKKGIFSELICPILYYEYIVGYIYVFNSMEKRERISKEMVNYLWQFSKILCYSLMVNGYFKAENKMERRYEAPVIDISASGLLFAHISPDLSRELLVHTDLEITIRIDKRLITAGSRIMRKFKDLEHAYFGVQFMQIDPQDFRFLFEYLYGKPFEAEYENTWEGGAPPPPLEL